VKISSPVGKLGEDLAAKFLQKLGFKIIERNFRKGYGEIDIIAIDQGVLVFVEVKTSSSLFLDSPLEHINYYKLQTLTRGANYYKLLHPELPEQMRIDAVSVILEKNTKDSKIELIKNIS
jgi:putative endonuclease